MARSFTEIVGMLQELLAYMNDAANVSALAAKGLDIVPLRNRVQLKLTAMTLKNVAQEQGKVALQNLTVQLNTATDDAYADASSVIDAMIGMLGKSTLPAKNLQRIRTGFGHSSPSPNPNPNPTPAPNPSPPGGP